VEADWHHVPDAHGLGVNVGHAPAANGRVCQQHGHFGGRHEWKSVGDRRPHDRGRRESQLLARTTVSGYAGVQRDQSRARRGAGEHQGRVASGSRQQGGSGPGTRSKPHRRRTPVGKSQSERTVENRLHSHIDHSIAINNIRPASIITMDLLITTIKKIL